MNRYIPSRSHLWHRPEMRAYKFVRPEDAHFLEGNSLLLGTSEHYSGIEDSRGDDLEASVRLKSGFFSTESSDQGAASRLHALETMGIFISPKSRRVTISGNVMQRTIPSLAIACFGYEAENVHWQKQGLTSVFEIKNVYRLARHIQSDYRSLLGIPMVSKVRYLEREFDVFHDDVGSPDPFIKRPKFAPERELRIVWKIVGAPFETLAVRVRPGMVRRIS